MISDIYCSGNIFCLIKYPRFFGMNNVYRFYSNKQTNKISKNRKIYWLLSFETIM